MHLEGKTAVVSGGTSGLGLATAKLLLERGANVAVLGSRGVAEIAAATGPEIFGVQADITDTDAVSRAIAIVVDRFGALHVNVNTAGIMTQVRLLDESGRPNDVAAVSQMTDINFVGTYRVIGECVAAMLHNPVEDAERGVVVNTSSISAIDGTPSMAAYAATKSAVDALALPLAREFAGRGIRFNTIVAGGFLTPMNNWMPQERLDAFAAQVPNPVRHGRPKEFAQMVVSLIENPYANAASIRLDGALRPK